MGIGNLPAVRRPGFRTALFWTTSLVDSPSCLGPGNWFARMLDLKTPGRMELQSVNGVHQIARATGALSNSADYLRKAGPLPTRGETGPRSPDVDILCACQDLP